VDTSPAMIPLARKRAPTAKFFVESLFAFELPRCHVITALGDVFCYQFDAGRSPHGLIRRAFAALEPDGVLIFDVVEIGLNRDRPPSFREGADWACLVRFDYDDKQDHLIRLITTFRKVGSLYQRAIWLKCSAQAVSG
jgi:SAM-dependent methyltransferase